MVVFVDYDRDPFPNNPHRNAGDTVTTVVYGNQLLADGNGAIPSNIVLTSPRCIPSDVNEKRNDQLENGLINAPSETACVRANPNVNSFSAALSCYPVVKELAKCVDLNTLDSLSRTCRQFRANLLVFRHQLIKLTLRCENESIQNVSRKLLAGDSIPDDLQHMLQNMMHDTAHWGLFTGNRVGKCARDMVQECRRCSRIMCRNCIVKPPSDSRLKHRLRRLCTTCRKAPLAYHLSPSMSSPLKDIDTKRDSSEQSAIPFTALAFSRTPCQCEQAVWLCGPCGQNLRNNDTSYRRVWMWRTRYSSYLGGGLGTGIGEGSQGVKCGRGEACLAAQEIEVEVDCETEDPNDGTSSVHTHENDLLHQQHHTGGIDSQDDSPGYLRQEIVGIGGVVKQKVKKRVTLGACVIEHEDEREKGTYLRREETGQHRSWCSWCWRVVPSIKDLQ